MVITLRSLICGLFVVLGLLLGYLLVIYAIKCNYHFWVSRCKNCQHFASEDCNLYGVDCKMQGQMIVGKIEQCEYFNEKKKIETQKG